MTDDELEQLLGRHQLAPPQSSLRARVLEAATGEPRRVQLGIVDYAMTAVAAGLILALTLIEAPPIPESAEASRQREVNAVAAALGGGPAAMHYAEQVASRDDEPVDPLLEGTW